MPQELRLLHDLESADLLSPLVYLENSFHQIVDMALCVDAPRDGQPQQLVSRLIAEHHRANFHRANAGVPVQFNG
jgi:hypothetical protein